MRAQCIEYSLQFARPAGTSRGVLTTRPLWFLLLEEGGKRGIGECAPLPGLSRETPNEVRQRLAEIVRSPERFVAETASGKVEQREKIPSVLFALETAVRDLQSGGRQLLFPSDFTEGRVGIPINGLIWMGDRAFMKEQIAAKLEQGFCCIKLKIGSLDFTEELRIIGEIRAEYSEDTITLRVDANGAFTAKDAPQKLRQLAAFGIHSIEQPIMAGRWQETADLCAEFASLLPIALDEELIGIVRQEKEVLLDTVRPQYLVLKPSLHGGWSGCDEWIALAEERGIGWWITSYLESNIGLNAIAQWAFMKMQGKNALLHQGLGTGGLFANNIASPLGVVGERLFYNPMNSFQLPF